MYRFILVGLMAAACTTPFGQKVTVLLTDETLSCVTPTGGGDAVASLELDQPEDFYQSEVIDQETGVAYLLPATREGTAVTFECPDGFSELIVRHATVLQAKQDYGTTPTTGGGAAAP